MTDGNTYAISKHLDEREDWDALQEVYAELEQAEARIEELEETLSLRTKLHGEATYVISDLEAKLAKAVDFIEDLLSGRDRDDDWRIEANAILAELSSVSCANLKGQDDG